MIDSLKQLPLVSAKGVTISILHQPKLSHNLELENGIVDAATPPPHVRSACQAATQAPRNSAMS